MSSQKTYLCTKSLAVLFLPKIRAYRNKNELNQMLINFHGIFLEIIPVRNNFPGLYPQSYPQFLMVNFCRETRQIAPDQIPGLSA
ncbi:hypothetical protein [Undibacterium sp. Ren11W]|uniref:hypothetical protein n=1 Tax=Undibacterium sp. Ren11W TaxID=3413045 RepID=UPI003BEF9E1B